MTPREILFEIPYLMVGSVDWGLNDPVRNRRRAELIRHSNPTEVRRDEHGTLLRRWTRNGGDFAYVDQGSDLLSHYMMYETATRPILGSCATQVKIWMTISEGTIGLTSDVFFNIMLREFDTMVSDRVQSEDGRRFWLRRLAEAARNRMTVGLLDGSEILKRDPAINIQKWVASVDAWGRTEEHRNRLFFISNHRD